MKTLWSSMIQPHVDYCFQLWCPVKSGDLQKIESIFRNFTYKITSIQNLNYWERLRALNTHSQERRLERYRILCTWKCIENLVPNIGITTYTSARRGRLCKIPPICHNTPRYAQTLREGSLNVRGPQLFNSLPQPIRNITGCSKDTFKLHLDKFLLTILDKPNTPGYPNRQANSIISIIK